AAPANPFDLHALAQGRPFGLTYTAALHGSAARSDVFAFGAALHEMITGKRAFQDKTQVSVMAAILEHDPPSLSAIDRSVPIALNRLVEKCLAKDPARRWQSASDLARRSTSSGRSW